MKKILYLIGALITGFGFWLGAGMPMYTMDEWMQILGMLIYEAVK